MVRTTGLHWLRADENPRRDLRWLFRWLEGQSGERNFRCPAREIPERLADDSVIIYFLFMLIAEDQAQSADRLP